MTVAAQIKQTLASLQGVRETLETFATIQKNESEKNKLEKNIERIDGIITALDTRIKVLEFEEPQYKGF